jgi:RimJ/RimL family protein N-acetyltransferase
MTLSVVELERPGATPFDGVLKTRLKSLAPLLAAGNVGLRHLSCTTRAASHPGSRAPTGDAMLEWDASDPAAAPRWMATQNPWRPDGPVLLLARDAWTHLEQRLMAAHFGRLYEWARPPEGAEGSWQLQDAGAFPAQAPGSLRGYLQPFHSFQFTLPLGAHGAVRSLAGFASQGWLVLAQARGWGRAVDFKAPHGELLTPARVREWQLPVNFEWLGAQLENDGACAWQERLGSREVVQVLAGGGGMNAQRVAEIARPLSSSIGLAADALADPLRRTLGAGDTGSALALLRLAHWHPDLFDQCVPAYASVLERTEGFHKAEWARALVRIWEHRETAADTASLARGIVAAALACHQLELAHEAVAVLLALRPEDEHAWGLQAQCLARTGQPGRALAICDRAAAAKPSGTPQLRLAAQLRERSLQMDQRWRRPYRHDEFELSLEPLHLQAASELAFQYRDEQIATMTGLPALSGSAKAHAWIADKLRETQAAYALIHPRWGFVGYVDLEVADQHAFFCFWIGTDFQGRGLAAPAARLACEWAFANGIELVMSTVYDDNTRSLRALRRAGFQVSELRALSPHDERTFVYRGARELEPSRAAALIRQFMNATNPEMRFPAAATLERTP